MQPRRGSGPAGGHPEWSGRWCSAWWPASAPLSTRHAEKQARALTLPEQRGGRRGVQGPLGRGGGGGDRRPASEAVERERAWRWRGKLPAARTESEGLALKWRSRTLREGGLLDRRLGLAGQMDVENAQDGEERRGKGRSARKVGADGNREVGGWCGAQVSFRKCVVWKESGVWATTSSHQKGLHRSVPHKRKKLFQENEDIGELTYRGEEKGESSGWGGLFGENGQGMGGLSSLEPEMAQGSCPHLAWSLGHGVPHRGRVLRGPCLSPAPPASALVLQDVGRSGKRGAETQDHPILAL